MASALCGRVVLRYIRMAMEINRNLPDYIVRKQNHSSYAAQDTAGGSAAGINSISGTKKKETEKRRRQQRTENPRTRWSMRMNCPNLFQA